MNFIWRKNRFVVILPLQVVWILFRIEIHLLFCCFRWFARRICSSACSEGRTDLLCRGFFYIFHIFQVFPPKKCIFILHFISGLLPWSPGLLHRDGQSSRDCHPHLGGNFFYWRVWVVWILSYLCGCLNIVSRVLSWCSAAGPTGPRRTWPAWTTAWRRRCFSLLSFRLSDGWEK